MGSVFVVTPGDLVGVIVIAVGLGCLGILKVQDALEARRRRRGA
jgi:hypothetical protein